MAKASVEKICPKCGAKHYWTSMQASRAAANRWEAWAEGQEHLCPDCYAAAMREQRDHERRQATEAGASAASDLCLPALTGSERQVAWAQAIRGETIGKLNLNPPDPRARECLLASIASHTEAKWWIDHKLDSVAKINYDSEDRLIEMLTAAELGQLQTQLEEIKTQLMQSQRRLFAWSDNCREAKQLARVNQRS